MSCYQCDAPIDHEDAMCGKCVNEIVGVAAAAERERIAKWMEEIGGWRNVEMPGLAAAIRNGEHEAEITKEDIPHSRT